MITIDFNDNELKPLIDLLMYTSSEQSFPQTAKALDQAARYTKNVWASWASGNQALPNIGKNPNPSSKMARSIKVENTGEWKRTISSDNRQMEQLANGSPAVEYDMKKTHPYGKHSRVSKKGIPYLIIPFRWGTPNEKNSKRARFANFIPQEEYQTGANVQSFKRSWITEYLHPEINARGEDIDRQEYKWESRLSKEVAWDKNAVGMVRMKSTGKGKPGTYFTFRIISADSPQDSWWYRKEAKEPINIIDALETAIAPEVERMIDEGLRRDIGQ